MTNHIKPTTNPPMDDFVANRKRDAEPQKPEPTPSLQAAFPGRERTVPVSVRVPVSLYEAVDKLKQVNKNVTLTDILVRGGREYLDRLLRDS